MAARPLARYGRPAHGTVGCSALALVTGQAGKTSRWHSSGAQHRESSNGARLDEAHNTAARLRRDVYFYSTANNAIGVCFPRRLSVAVSAVDYEQQRAAPYEKDALCVTSSLPQSSRTPQRARAAHWLWPRSAAVEMGTVQTLQNPREPVIAYVRRRRR